MGFRWREVHVGDLDVPQMSLAGRSDEPVNSRGNAVAALVQAGTQALNSASINHAIERERRRQTQFLPAYFEGHGRGGVLAIAAIDNTRVGEMSAQRFMHLELFPGVYAQPRHAISVWRRRPRMNSAVGTPAYRFYWVTRDND